MSSDYSADDYSCAGFYKLCCLVWLSVFNTMLGNDKYKQMARSLLKLFHGGNKQAISIFEDYCYVIANQILSIQGILDVKRFVIGGGISAQKILVEEINRQFNTIIKSNPILEVNIPKDIEIMATKFGNDANQMIVQEKVKKQRIQVFKSGEREGISGVVKGLQGAEFTWKLKSEVDNVGWDNAKTYAVNYNQ